MGKEAKTNAMRILEREKVPYTAHEYAHEEGVAVDGVTVAASMGEDPACVYKTLVTQGASKNYFVFVIPVAAELDLKAAARSVGEKSVAMIHVADINKVTGYVRGGCRHQFSEACLQSGCTVPEFCSWTPWHLSKPADCC